MEEQIKQWLLQAEQIYNSFERRIKISAWKSLFEEIHAEEKFFRKIRNCFLMFLKEHPFLSSEVWRFIEETFHITEDYYQLEKSEAEPGLEDGDIKEFLQIIAKMYQEKWEVLPAIFYQDVRFDVDNMEPSSDREEETSVCSADDYIREYLDISARYFKNDQDSRDYYRQLCALSRYGFTSLYELQNIMWLTCLMGDFEKSLSAAEKLLRKTSKTIFSAAHSYRAYLCAELGDIARAKKLLVPLDREENTYRDMIRTGLAICEMQEGNFFQAVNIIQEMLDYSQTPFHEEREDLIYTPHVFPVSSLFKENDIVILASGQAAYQSGRKTLCRAYGAILQENRIYQNAEDILIEAEAYLNVGDCEKAHDIIFNEHHKQMMIKARCQTEYFIVMADVLYAEKNCAECIRTAESIDGILARNSEACRGKWGEAEYTKKFCHNLYLMADCYLREKNYESAFLYAGCLLEEEYIPAKTYLLHQKAGFFLHRFRTVKKDYYVLHNYYRESQAGYYAVQAVLRQKDLRPERVRYQQAADILGGIREKEEVSAKFNILKKLVQWGISDTEKERQQLYEEGKQIYERMPVQEDIELVLIMAEFASETGRNREAYQYLNQYRKQHESAVRNPLFQYDYGVYLETVGREEEAIQIYRELLNDYGMYGDIGVRLSRYHKECYAQSFLKEEQKSALHYLQKQREDEENPHDLELAEFLYEIMEFERAMEAFCDDPESENIWYWQRRYELMGNCLLRIYRPEPAKNYFIRALQIGLENEQVYFQTAEAARECKCYEEALCWHQKAVQKYGDNYLRGYEAMGDIYLQISEKKKALAYYKMSLVLADRIAETKPEEGEWLRMRYYKRMVHFYLSEKEYHTALLWAEKAEDALSIVPYQAEFAAFYAEALLCSDVGEAINVLEDSRRMFGNELMERGNYRLLMSMEAQLISYYYISGSRSKSQMEKMANTFMDIFKMAYPRAKFEDYAEVKAEAADRFGELGWYYLALGKDAFAKECFRRQWSVPPCHRCRSRAGCYKGYLNVARCSEKAGEYNRAIYFYREVLSERMVPDHAQAGEALKKLQQIPKAERGKEFNRW